MTLDKTGWKNHVVKKTNKQTKTVTFLYPPAKSLKISLHTQNVIGLQYCHGKKRRKGRKRGSIHESGRTGRRGHIHQSGRILEKGAYT